MSRRRTEGWIGVDFDATLAKNPDGRYELGEPVPEMVGLVKKWLREGREVRVVTARACDAGGPEARASRIAEVEMWCAQHVGQVLPVTNEKDFAMLELWDDRAVGVVPDAGLRCDEVAVDTAIGAIATWVESVHDSSSYQTTDDLVRGILRGDWKR